MAGNRIRTGIRALALAGLSLCAFAGEEALDERLIVEEKVVGIDEIPAAAKAAILKRQEERKARITELVVKTVKSGARYYEAELQLPNNAEMDYVVNPEGKPVGVENESAAGDRTGWQREFAFEGRKLSTKGRSRFLILEPGHQLTLEGMRGKDALKLVITVLDETRKVGGVETRVVEERETVNGVPSEVSRNFLAICEESKSVFYFGEEVDEYKDGKIVSHTGAWLAEKGARPGILMPGEPIVGARFYQEVAPEVAMDRAEVMGFQDFKTHAGEHRGCLVVEETNDLEPGVAECKVHAPGIGLVRDGVLVLTKHGFVK